MRRFPKTPGYGAAWLRFKHDFFADTRLRSIVAPAVGYAFQPDNGSLNVEIGPTRVGEDFDDQPDQTFWGPGLFVDYTQGLLQGFTATHICSIPRHTASFGSRPRRSGGMARIAPRPKRRRQKADFPCAVLASPAAGVYDPIR